MAGRRGSGTASYGRESLQQVGCHLMRDPITARLPTSREEDPLPDDDCPDPVQAADVARRIGA